MRKNALKKQRIYTRLKCSLFIFFVKFEEIFLSKNLKKIGHTREIFFLLLGLVAKFSYLGQAATIHGRLEVLELRFSSGFHVSVSLLILVFLFIIYAYIYR
jgi:hypothetical protein